MFLLVSTAKMVKKFSYDVGNCTLLRDVSFASVRSIAESVEITNKMQPCNTYLLHGAESFLRS